MWSGRTGPRDPRPCAVTVSAVECPAPMRPLHIVRASVRSLVHLEEEEDVGRCVLADEPCPADRGIGLQLTHLGQRLRGSDLVPHREAPDADVDGLVPSATPFGDDVAVRY